MVAIPAPVSGLTQWIWAFVTLEENTFQNLQTLQPKNKQSVKCVQILNKSNPYIYLSRKVLFFINFAEIQNWNRCF